MQSLQLQSLSAIAQAMFASGKGLLAMDESTGTIGRRFTSAGIPLTEDMRRAYRDLLVTAPGLADSISGAILYDETMHQATKDGQPFIKVLADAGIIPGIKVDMGATDLAGHPGEQVTEGLDGLRARLKRYRDMGARFAKWRGVINIGDTIPSAACMDANAHVLARYAALCQEADIVPIVEPEVLADGSHSLERCREVTRETLHRVFAQLHDQGVVLEAMVLKPNMVTSGLSAPTQASVAEVADATLRCLRETVPAAIAGIAFLSGGQSGELATAHLAAMIERGGSLPWPLSFSYGRALQQPALEIWAGKDTNRVASQQALLKRARLNFAARSGQYDVKMEAD